MKALLAVDGSDYTKKMLAYLVTHEELLGPNPQLFVLNVQPKVTARAARFLDRTTIENYYRSASEEILSPVGKFLERRNADFDTDYRAGHPAEEILKFAKRKKVDIIVMGSRGQGAISTFMLGSVAQKVLTLSDVPVLIVR
jgi:nucleotide-binding universal stress UspA family protein